MGGAPSNPELKQLPPRGKVEPISAVSRPFAEEVANTTAFSVAIESTAHKNFEEMGRIYKDVNEIENLIKAGITARAMMRIEQLRVRLDQVAGALENIESAAQLLTAQIARLDSKTQSKKT